MYKIGDVVTMGTTTLTVSGIEYSQGQEYSEPAEGYQFLVVDLTLENKGSQAVTISSLMQMTVKDADHYQVQRRSVRIHALRPGLPRW